MTQNIVKKWNDLKNTLYARIYQTLITPKSKNVKEYKEAYSGKKRATLMGAEVECAWRRKNIDELREKISTSTLSKCGNSNLSIFLALSPYGYIIYASSTECHPH